MKRLFAIIGTVPLVLAACGDDDDDNASATIPVGSSTASDTVQVVQAEGVGSVLADSDGMVLYFNDQDSASAVKCVESCTDEWPPVEESETPTAAGVTGLGTAERPDGSKQLTYNGHPLYTFVDDDAPMKATGDGDADEFDGQQFTWHAATTEAAAGGTATTMAGNSQSSSAPSTTGY